MLIVDADTHVVETERAWDYLEEHEQQFRPVPVTGNAGDGLRDFWLVEGRLAVRGGRHNIAAVYPRGTHDLTDLEARLRDIDRLGVDVQVVVPTFFLSILLTRPEVELALCRSYNRYLAEIWSKSKGRLRWLLVPPLMSPEHVVAELKFGKAHGACGVLMRGYERGRLLSDPYFLPLYEQASRLDLAICIHVGNSTPLMREVLSGTGLTSILPVIAAFHALLASDVPDRFPTLRFGFLEASASWLPFAIQEAARAAHDGARRQGRFAADALKQRRFFVACQVDDDLPYLLDYAGEDSLVFGTDYGHADIGTDIEGHRLMRERGDVDPAVIRKIVGDNARVLYGI